MSPRRKLSDIRNERRALRGTNANMSLVAHLGELRIRLVIVIVAVLIGSAIAFAMWDWVLQQATAPYCHAQASRKAVSAIEGASNCQLYISNPVELLTTRVTTSTYLGIVIALPVIAFQFWRFVTPGLNPKEKRYVIPFVLSSIVLFGLGVLVAWFTTPQALNFFLTVGGSQIQTLFNPTPYLKLISLMMLLFGLAFETPLVLIFLQLARVITSAQLRKVRRFAIVGNSIIAAVATPSQDPYSMLAMFIPLCVFYEIAIIVGRCMKR